MIKLAMFLPPVKKGVWNLAAQAGIAHAVVRLRPEYPSWTPEALENVQSQLQTEGLDIAALEGDQIDMTRIKLGLPGRDEDLDTYCRMLQNMGERGIHLLCYNFMAGVGWFRSRTDIATRGNALTSGFFPADVPDEPLKLTHEQLWDNYAYFLRAVLPAAEKANVFMCLHPDDPPVPRLKGYPRIFTTADAFRKMLHIAHSPYAGITFCAATFRMMGEDDIALIREWKDRIRFVHMRDNQPLNGGFVETFHGAGPTDLAERFKLLHDLNMEVLIRPDHAPTMFGEDNSSPGYAALGRLIACGYFKGIMDTAHIPYD